MDRTFTPEQENAINAKKSFVIVSAAAGSGKTTVMIEKLIRILSDCENKTRADRLIIVTFTNDAAAQLSRRLYEEVSKAISSCGEDEEKKKWLLTQKTYLGAAKISTISSFCFDLIREYPDAAGITPDFKICDEQESKIYLIRAIEETADEYFGDSERSDKLTDIYELFGFFSKPSYDKESVFGELLQLRSFLLSIPFYKERFLNVYLEDYKKGFSDEFSPKSTVFGKRYFDIAYEALGDPRLKNAVITVYSGWEELLENPRLMEENCKKKNAKNHFLSSCEYIVSLHEYLENFSYELEKEDFSSEDWDRMIKASYPKGDFFRTDLALSTRKSEIKTVTEMCAECDFSPEDILEAFDEIIKITSKLRDIIPCTSEELRADYMRHFTLLSEISEFLDDVNTRFSEIKREKNVLDFSDAEAFALGILGKTENGKIIKTEIAEKLSEQYDMILIDEFQDSNDMQDIIFRLLSPRGDSVTEGKNMFIVGDIKQSIYNFRLSNPMLFRKYLKESLSYTENPDSEEPRRILLNMNFRSSREVIDFVNLVFEKTMSENSGGIDYDDSQKLISSGASWEENNRELSEKIGDLQTEILLIDKANTPFFVDGDSGGGLSDDDDEDGIKSDIFEAEAVALKIKRLIGDGNKIHPKDICVLCRTNEQAERFASAIGKLGISASAGDTGEYIDSREISFMLSFLRIIDDPHNDTAFAAVLMSPVFMFSADNMASLSYVRKDESYYTLLRNITDENNASEILKELTEEKQIPIKTFAKDFFEKFDRIRKLSSVYTIENIIRSIYLELSVVEIMSLYPDGDSKRANLLLLPEYAAAFEKGKTAGSGGIYAFIRFVDTVSANRGIDFASGSVSSESDDAVAVKTIHKSKGLEYPIVFLCRTSSVSRARIYNVYYTSSDGIAFFTKGKYDRAGYLSLPAQVIALEKKHNERRELMRLLYVALTRAKCKLYISGIVKLAKKDEPTFCPENSVPCDGIYKNSELDITNCAPVEIFSGSAEKLLKSAVSEGSVDTEVFMKTSDSLIYPIAAALRASGTVPFFDSLDQKKSMSVPIKVSALRDDRKLFWKLSGGAREKDRQNIFSYTEDEEFLSALEIYKSYDTSEKYSSDREKENIPAKLTVTEITRRTAIPPDEEVVYPEFLPVHDEFHTAKEYGTSLSGAEKGTAVHTFMQYADLREISEKIKNGADDPIGNEAHRLFFEGKMSEAEARYLSENKKFKRRIAAFFSSEIWEKFYSKAKPRDIFTEIPFMAKISDIFDKNSEKPLDLILKTYYNDNYSDTFVQGIADLIIRTENGFVLVDYKTNEGKSSGELKNMYRTQLLLYKRVFERIYGLPEETGEAYIFSLGNDEDNIIKIE